MAKGTLNKAILIGRLGQDPKLQYTPSGKACTKISLATNESWKKDGEKQEVTDWHNIVLWGKIAEIAAEYLSKGSRVYVEGKIRTRSWDKDGTTHYMTEVIGDRVEFLDSKKAEISEQQPEQSEEDIPF